MFVLPPILCRILSRLCGRGNAARSDGGTGRSAGDHVVRAAVLHRTTVDSGLHRIGGGIMGTLGVVAGIWADKFDQLAAFQNFLIMPLTMLSGVFYSIHSLPEFWQQVSRFNVFYMIDGFASDSSASPTWRRKPAWPWSPRVSCWCRRRRWRCSRVVTN